MNWPLLLILLLACALMMVLESRGLRTTLKLSFKGDVKRETAFLAQWGQSIATPLVTLIICQLDPLAGAMRSSCSSVCWRRRSSVLS